MQIGILGAGTWGMALAAELSRGGHDVTVWSAVEREIDEFSSTRRHPNLPGMAIPDAVRFTKEIASVCEKKEVLVFAVPSVFVRSTARRAAPFILPEQVVVDVAKGVESDTMLTMTQVLESELPHGVRLVALSGPTHAEEVALRLPTTAVSASRDGEAARLVQQMFANTCMRIYTGSDVLGVELSGAMKNIIALASGIAAGLGYGDNTKAALITRGIAEIRRLGEKMGCRRETFSGLAGIGDLIVTATSMHSRNNRCGMLIGQGVEPMEAVKQVGMVVEGVNALPAAMHLQEKYQVELPIISAVDAIINHGASPTEAVRKLMARDMGEER